MTRFLTATALGIGLLATVAPASPANACEFSQCAWGQIVCTEISCPTCIDAGVVRRCILR